MTPTAELEDDWQLLRDYAQNRTQPAFAALVHRHVDLVHAAALRQVRDPALAQDVTQAVFILLADKAASLTPDSPLSAWLLTATRYTANNALKMQRRRQHHEQLAAAGRSEKTATAEADQAWSDIAPHLDRALDALPPADRAAVCLRYFENKPLAQVGVALGVSTDAAEKRVSRAIDKLRAFFTNRGLTLSAAIVAGLLPTRAVEAAPCGTAATILTTLEGSTRTFAHALASATARSMHAGAAKLLGVLAAAVVILATCVLIVVAQSGPAKPQAGGRAASANSAGGPALISTAGLTEVRRLSGHPAGATALAATDTEFITASPAPPLLGSYAAPKRTTTLIRFLDISTGRETARLSVDGASVTGLAFEPPSRLVVDMEPGGRRTWNRDTRQWADAAQAAAPSDALVRLRPALEALPFKPTLSAATPDGRHLLVLGPDDVLHQFKVNPPNPTK